jgi:hypothetical protein
VVIRSRSGGRRSRHLTISIEVAGKAHTFAFHDEERFFDTPPMPCKEMYMLRLMYVSTATAEMNDTEIPRILESATRNNTASDIRGALMFNGVNFAQILEGETGKVEALMETLKADPRHTGIVIIGRMEVDEYRFQDWTMQLIEGLDFDPLFQAMV